jgi:hypothetical protein
VSSVPASTPVTVLEATPVARPATSATNATVVTDAPRRHEQPVLQQRRQGEEVHPDDRAHPDRDEIGLPGGGQPPSSLPASSNPALPAS